VHRIDLVSNPLQASKRDTADDHIITTFEIIIKHNSFHLLLDYQSDFKLFFSTFCELDLYWCSDMIPSCSLTSRVMFWLKAICRT
jgi:hypothetical protein